METERKHKETKKVVEDGYDKVAYEYAKLEGESEWPRMKWLNKVLEKLEHGSSILDLGCGSGDPADIEISREHKVTGIDISEKQITLARKNVPDGNFIHDDLGSVDFPSNSFEAVVSFYTLEHIPREEHKEIFLRINKWLKTKGYFLVSMEAGEYEGGVGEWLGVSMYFSSYDPETVRKMIADAGFEILVSAIETQIENGTKVPFLWVLSQKR